MLKRFHQRLANKSEAYRDWHRSSWSSLRNAVFMLMFSLLMAGVTWYAINPGVFVEGAGKLVLGAAVGPDGETVDSVGINIIPMKSESIDEHTFAVRTTRAAGVWVEYDEEYNNAFYKLRSPKYGTFHIFILPNLESGKTYVYRVGTRDEFNVIKYSRIYSFRK